VGSQAVNDQEQMSEVRLGAPYRRKQLLAALGTQSEPEGSGYMALLQPQPAQVNRPSCNKSAKTAWCDRRIGAPFAGSKLSPALS
jgi:hypothetical protein